MMTQELDLEDPLAIVQRLNEDDGTALVAALTDNGAQTLVDRLKAGADKYWWINPNCSLEMANTVIRISVVRSNLKHKALGMMARGDALKLLGNSEEAWNALGEAGEVFLQIDDQIGWARTRIGRVALCVNINKVEQALHEGATARSIFLLSKMTDFLLRLDFNIALIFYYRGEHEQALKWYYSALQFAQSLGEAAKHLLSAIYRNLGLVYCELLGDYHTASDFYQRAYEIAIMLSETKNIALTEHNMAVVAIAQGHYSQALQLLYHARELFETEKLFFDANNINFEIVDCYLILNRLVEARELISSVIDTYHRCNASYYEAHALLHSATIEAELSQFNAAKNALNMARIIFEELEAKTWLAVIQLRRGRLALEENEIIEAKEAVTSATVYFEASNQKVHFAEATLLKAEVLLAANDTDGAISAAMSVLQITQKSNIPLLRYSAHLILGRAAEAQNDLVHAIRRYSAAIATHERVQQELSITLRPGFLEGNDEALQNLIVLYLRMQNEVAAFKTLERAKSQVFFNYISNRLLLHWPQDDPKCQSLIQELDQLRGEHHWWYQKAHVEVKVEQINDNTIVFEDALKEITIRERRMRTITEQLYLQSSANTTLLPSSTPRFQDIQGSLDEQTLLIEFYHDDKNVWIFTVDAATCSVQQAPISISIIKRNLDFLHFNIDTALNTGTSVTQMSTLTKQIQLLLQHLFEQLLLPIISRLHNYQRLIFVPYGSLHYMPFHLLFTGAAYLIEHYEIIVLPAAGYVTRIGPSHIGGASVIAHSLNGTLPHALDEAHFVHNLFGGTICVEDDASRSSLQKAPTQILHIAAHAEFRQQQPDLSYIELADGQLFTDDLFQQDMSYELVTLSACETGRSHVASSDELIGLGRGFLYAGAGALVTSLWRVIDDVTPHLMQHFYRELYAGASKAAALRTAQLAILSKNPQLHPAFWGAFQLVGDPRPLSSNTSAKNDQ